MKVIYNTIIPFNGFKAHEAYCALLFEREAYAHQGEEGYLDSRRHYAWIRR